MDDITDAKPPIEVTLRIPGLWSDPGELIERLPPGYELQPDSLIMPDGTQLQFSPAAADGDFAKIFESACRYPASEEEMDIVNNYTVNVILSGPGGSMKAAQAMMKAGAAIVQAGGAGVFVDNSGLAHGGSEWLGLAEEGGPDAVSFAFVGIVRGQEEVWTMGMQVPGFPDISMKNSDTGQDGKAIVDLIRYICAIDAPIEPGHCVGDQSKPHFRIEEGHGHRFEAGSPMHNPMGHWKMVSMRDIAERN